MKNPSLENLWGDYLRAEQSQIRHESMWALGLFIDRLLQEPEATWHAWAKDVAASTCDRGAEMPLRFPLFQRVLLPALTSGVLKGEPGCARWLASFESLLVRLRDGSLPPELRTEIGLLREAIRVDPSDALALKRLVDRRARDLRFTLHELPSGVLYGMNGATAEQCDDLLMILAEFKAHVAATAQSERFADLIDECEFHYRAYADYRRLGSPAGGYALYLAHRGTRREGPEPVEGPKTS